MYMLLDKERPILYVEWRRRFCSDVQGGGLVSRTAISDEDMQGHHFVGGGVELP
jgi:hypothetical protein